MPRPIATTPRTPRTPLSPVTPLSPGKRNRRRCFPVILQFSQTIMFLLGLTYAIVVLVPLVKHQSVMLQQQSTNGDTTATGTIARNAPTSSLLRALEGYNIGYSGYPSLLSKFVNVSLQGNSKPCPPTTALSSSNNYDNLIQPQTPLVLPNPNRTIALIHVGKTAGISVRRMTIIFCKLFFTRKKQYSPETVAEKVAKCAQKNFPDPNATLAHQTQYYFHLEEYKEQELADATSFLVTLRNPVDRIISTYRYSHPGNCNDGNRKEVWRPRGCEAERHRNETHLLQNTLWYKCFPSPAMEEFAQALLRPWKRANVGESLSSQEERRHCRYLAREMVQGHGTWGSAPHMVYNYAYYAQRSVWKYPNKEVLAVRTEHMDDIKNLDRMLGGNNNLRENIDVSHGSEGYVPSPLTTEAYQKLCCVLEMELEIYLDLLDRAANLDATAKHDSRQSLFEKCAITTATWAEWRFQCRKKLRKDLLLLKPSLVVNETKTERRRGSAAGLVR